MERIRTVEMAAYVGRRVRLQGWLHAVRRLGGVSFVVLRDGWGTAQAVTEADADLAPLAGLALETVLQLEGEVVAAPAVAGGVELHRPRFTVLTPVNELLPVTLHKRQMKVALPTLQLLMATDMRLDNRQVNVWCQTVQALDQTGNHHL